MTLALNPNGDNSAGCGCFTNCGIDPNISTPLVSCGGGGTVNMENIRYRLEIYHNGAPSTELNAVVPMTVYSGSIYGFWAWLEYDSEDATYWYFSRTPGTGESTVTAKIAKATPTFGYEFEVHNGVNSVAFRWNGNTIVDSARWCQIRGTYPTVVCVLETTIGARLQRYPHLRRINELGATINASVTLPAVPNFGSGPTCLSTYAGGTHTIPITVFLSGTDLPYDGRQCIYWSGGILVATGFNDVGGSPSYNSIGLSGVASYSGGTLFGVYANAQIWFRCGTAYTNQSRNIEWGATVCDHTVTDPTVTITSLTLPPLLNTASNASATV